MSANVRTFVVAWDSPPPQRLTSNTMSTTTTAATTAAPARKATTTTARAEMTPAEITAAAAALIIKYKTISGIDGHSAALREKYGPKSWAAIRKAAQDIRRAEITAHADNARAAVFAYRPVLASMFKALSKNADFRKLCALARATYKGTDTDAAARLVRDFAPAVDAETGAPVIRVAYINKARTAIYTAYSGRELTDADALRALKSALSGLAKATRDAARKGKDGAPVPAADNKKTPGVIVGVYAATRDAETGVYSAGADMTKATADTAAARKTADAAARIVGAPVPSDAVPVSAVNADARKAHADAAAAALSRERAALAADATAAGVATAPRKARKGGKKTATATDAPAPDAATVSAARAAMDAVNATIADGRTYAAAAVDTTA